MEQNQQYNKQSTRYESESYSVFAEQSKWSILFQIIHSLRLVGIDKKVQWQCINNWVYT